MTYKAAAAGLDLGGGKAVIIGDPRTVQDRGAAAARTAGSSRTSAGATSPPRTWGPRSADMDMIRRETRHVGRRVRSRWAARATRRPHRVGRLPGHARRAPRRPGATRPWRASASRSRASGKVGSGSRATCVEARRDDRRGRRRRRRGRRAWSASSASRPVDPDAIHAVECDVFAPCALGGALNDRHDPRAALRRRLRRGEQPARARRSTPRRCSARHPVRARLRDERRRDHQHLRGVPPGGYDPERARRSGRAHRANAHAGSSVSPASGAHRRRRPPTASPRSDSARVAARRLEAAAQ